MCQSAYILCLQGIRMCRSTKEEQKTDDQIKRRCDSLRQIICCSFFKLC